MKGDQLVWTIKENIWKISGNLRVNFTVQGLPLFCVKSFSGLDQPAVHVRILIAAEIVLTFLLLRRMPHHVIVGIAAELPTQYHRIEVFLIDILMDERRPFD